MSRKVINGGTVSTKDANGAYLPSGKVPPPPRKRLREPKARDISLSDLMDKYLLLLYRETKNLLLESAKDGKLSKESSYAMRENAKLVVDLKKKEKELLDSLPTEELEKLLKDEPNE